VELAKKKKEEAQQLVKAQALEEARIEEEKRKVEETETLISLTSPQASSTRDTVVRVFKATLDAPMEIDLDERPGSLLPLPEPIPTNMGILDPHTQQRLQKLKREIQLSNGIALGLGEPNSPPVLHALSQANIMDSLVMELQVAFRERLTLEERIKHLEARNKILEANHLSRERRLANLEVERARNMSAEDIERLRLQTINPFLRLGPPTSTITRSPPRDIIQELRVKPVNLPDVPQHGSSGGFKRARNPQANRRGQASRDASMSLDRSRDTKRARTHSQQPAKNPGPQQKKKMTRTEFVQLNKGRGVRGSNYHGKNFDPNYKYRGPRRGGGEGDQGLGVSARR
jgi:hypothetical protein